MLWRVRAGALVCRAEDAYRVAGTTSGRATREWRALITGTSGVCTRDAQVEKKMARREAAREREASPDLVKLPGGGDIMGGGDSLAAAKARQGACRSRACSQAWRACPLCRRWCAPCAAPAVSHGHPWLKSRRTAACADCDTAEPAHELLAGRQSGESGG